MTKIVYNACYGGFGLSYEAVMRYAELKGLTLYPRKEGSFNSYYYYLCSPEDFDRIRQEDSKKPTNNRFARSNAMYFSVNAISRSDPALVQVVEELGSNKASGQYACLKIFDLEPGTLYRIDEYDGYERVATQDSYDWNIA